MNEIEYEKQISSRILTNPTFTLPEITKEEVAVNSVGAIRNSIYSAIEALAKSGVSHSRAIR